MIRPVGADISRFCDLDRYKTTGVQIRNISYFYNLLCSHDFWSDTIYLQLNTIHLIRYTAKAESSNVRKLRVK